jgi:hypothetical protein
MVVVKKFDAGFHVSRGAWMAPPQELPILARLAPIRLPRTWEAPRLATGRIGILAMS